MCLMCTNVQPSFQGQYHPYFSNATFQLTINHKIYFFASIQGNFPSKQWNLMVLSQPAKLNPTQPASIRVDAMECQSGKKGRRVVRLVLPGRKFWPRKARLYDTLNSVSECVRHTTLDETVSFSCLFESWEIYDRLFEFSGIKWTNISFLSPNPLGPTLVKTAEKNLGLKNILNMAATMRVRSLVSKFAKGNYFQRLPVQISAKSITRLLSSSRAVYFSTDGIESNPFYEKYAERIKVVRNEIKEGRL